VLSDGLRERNLNSADPYRPGCGPGDRRFESGRSPSAIKREAGLPVQPALPPGYYVGYCEAKVRELIRYGAPSEEFPEPPRIDAEAGARFRVAARRGLFER
jgi:hypothetical protein